MYPLLVACKSQSNQRRDAAMSVVEAVRIHSAALVEQAQLVRPRRHNRLHKCVRLHHDCSGENMHAPAQAASRVQRSFSLHYAQCLLQVLACQLASCCAADVSSQRLLHLAC